jgi:hypothetical protein
MAVSGGTRTSATGPGREFLTGLAAKGSAASLRTSYTPATWPAQIVDRDGDGKPDVESAAALVDVLPEVSMPYRRRLAYAGIAMGFVIALVSACRASPESIWKIATGAFGTVGLFTLLYMNGAKTEHLARLVEAGGIIGSFLGRGRRADPYAYTADTDFDAEPGALLEGLAPEAGPRMEG